MENQQEGHWVTIDGTHVLIKPGETIGQAFKRTTGKKLSSKGDSDKAAAKRGFDPDKAAPSTADDRQKAKDRGAIVPPTSWDLWVNPDPNGKIVAKWKDAKGRTQAAYSAEAVANRDAHKFEGLHAFKSALPKIRESVESDLDKSDAQKERVAAAVVKLIDATTMRVGSEKYAKENGTYGASSLRKDHVKVEGDTVTMSFVGKHNQNWERSVKDSKLASAVSHLMSLPGDRVFQFHSADGSLRPLTEQAVGEYLKPFGATPKQFRTYHASELAFHFLRELGVPKSEADAKKNIAIAVKKTSEILGNTPAVARSSYIAPAILDSYARSVGAATFSEDEEMSQSDFDEYLDELLEDYADGKVMDKDPFLDDDAMFSAGALDSQATFSADGQTVYREGVIFECGNYPDKEFSLTTDEADAYVAAYQPVEFHVEHDVPLPDKPLLESIKRVGNQIIGRAKLPVWLDKLVPTKGVSCSWNRSTKQLREISFTSRPRIANAALFSGNQPAVDPAIPNKEKPMAKPIKEWFEGLRKMFTEDVPAEFSEGTSRSTATDSEETKRLREQLEAERRTRINSEAASFADTAINTSKATPAERQYLVNAYVGAAMTDAANPATFANGQSAVASLKAIVEARPVHALTLTAAELEQAIKDGKVTVKPDDKGANFTRGDEKKIDQFALDPATVAEMRKHADIAKEAK